MATFTLDPIYGCITSDRIDAAGYAITWRGRQPIKAYLVEYERNVGPIPDGMTLDHTCCNRACVASHHLEPVTQLENVKRRAWRYRSQLRKCPKGHSLADAIVTPWKGRVCRSCNAEAKIV